MPCLKNCPKFVPCLTNAKKCQTGMACNGGVLIPPPPAKVKIFNPPLPSNFLLSPSTGNGCFYIFQQAHVHISEAIITD